MNLYCIDNMNSFKSNVYFSSLYSDHDSVKRSTKLIYDFNKEKQETFLVKNLIYKSNHDYSIW